MGAETIRKGIGLICRGTDGERIGEAVFSIDVEKKRYEQKGNSGDQKRN